MTNHAPAQLVRPWLFLVLGCLTLAAGAAPQIRVACVGASITYGSGLNDRDHASYPARLGLWLGRHYDVRNFGVGGTTVMHEGDRPYFQQKEHDQAVDFKPGILMILLGTNDSKHPGDGSLESEQAPNNWQYKEHFVADYEELIAGFRKANPDVKVYVCLLPPCFPGRWGINDRTIHTEVNPMVRQVAAATGATLIDLYSAMGNQSIFQVDGVHPNDAGARLLAATIYRAVTGSEPPATPGKAN